MALKIDIKAGEQFVLNNTTMHLTKSSALIIESRATFIRVKDIFRIEDVDTPAKEIYYLCQQGYLDESKLGEIIQRIEKSCAAFVKKAPSAESLILQLRAVLAQPDTYRALKLAKQLVKFEEDAVPPTAARIWRKPPVGSRQSSVTTGDTTEIIT